MKKLLVLAAALFAVGCGSKSGSNSATTGDNASGTDGSNGTNGGGTWGCQTNQSGCVCQLNPPAGEFPDTSCSGSSSGTGCAYETTQDGITECIYNPSIPSSQCAGLASAAGGTVVTGCPPGGSSSSAGTTNGTNSTAGNTSGTNSSASNTTGTNSSASNTTGTNSSAGTSTGTNSSAGTSTGTNSSAGTTGSSGSTWGCQTSNGQCFCMENPQPGQFTDTSCAGSAPGVGCSYEITSNGQTECVFNAGIDNSQCASLATAAGGTQVDSCPPPSGSTTSTNSTAGTNSSAGTSTGTSSSAGTTTGTSSSAGTTTGTNSSAGTTTGTNSSAGTTTGTSSSAGTTTGTTTGTNSSAGTTTGTNAGTSTGGGGTDGPHHLGSGTGVLNGSTTQPFTVAGAFEEPGTDATSGRPNLKFLMFDAPMTCSMFQAHQFPPYYGYLGDGRIVFTSDHTAHDVFLPNGSDVPQYPTDGGSAYYIDINGNRQSYSPISLTNFPSSTNIVVGAVTSSNSSAVGLGSYAIGGGVSYLGKGWVSLNGGTPNITSIATSGDIDYTGLNSSALVGDFNVTLAPTGSNATGWGCTNNNGACACNSATSCQSNPATSCSTNVCCYTSTSGSTTNCTCTGQASCQLPSGVTAVTQCPPPGALTVSCGTSNGVSGSLSGSFTAVPCSGF